ncbi:MAG: T9SS type A sorting domain-containing protein [Candidatus Limimorpha sp.]
MNKAFLILVSLFLPVMVYGKDYLVTVVQPVGGVITVSDTMASVGKPITLTKRPLQGFAFRKWNVYKSDDPNTLVNIVNDGFIMPAYDVTVAASFPLSFVLNAPEAICSGETLSLHEPLIAEGLERGWQIDSKSEFGQPVAYTGQPLTFDFDGWYLRFWAGNGNDTVCSSVVRIAVVEVPEIVIEGEAAACHLQTIVYEVKQEPGWQYEWMVTNGTANPQGNKVGVLWDGELPKGHVKVEAKKSGMNCLAVGEMEVALIRTVEPEQVNEIVVKTNTAGQAYILIYPNPAEGMKYQWYKDNEAITDADGQYYYRSGGLPYGIYKVYVSMKSDESGRLYCGAFSKPCQIFGLDKGTFVVFPNPSGIGNEISIVRNDGAEATVAVYAIDGRLLHYQSVNGNTDRLDLNLRQGVYFIRLTDSHQNTSVQKIVIK